MVTRTSVEPLREQVRDTQALMPKSVFLAILTSVVGTALTGFVGTDRLGTFAGAAVLPLVSAVFTTSGRGTARILGITILTGIAVVFAFTGYTLSDILRGGQSLVANREGTFIKPPGTGGGSDPDKGSGDGPTGDVSVPKQVQCPAVAVNGTSTCRFGVRPAGSTTITVTGAELGGKHKDDFVLTKVCKGTIRRNESCSIRIKFAPTDEGDRQAEVTVKASSGTAVVRLRGKGLADEGTGCADGYVPREATDGDTVCVTPGQKAAAARQNQAHADEQRAQADGFCVQGFVWREATPGDRVCVTPDERSAAAAQNAEGPSHVAS